MASPPANKVVRSLGKNSLERGEEEEEEEDHPPALLSGTGHFVTLGVYLFSLHTV